MKKTHYAWMICFGCALMMFCNNGIIFYIFSVFFPFIVKEHGISNTQASFMTTCRMISGLAAVYLSGWMYRHTGLRRGITLAGCFSTISMMIYALAQGYYMVLAGAVMSGIGYGFGATVPVAMFLNRWFLKKRNSAMALCSIAASAALVGFPSLFTHCIQEKGLRLSFMITAAMAAVLTLTGFLILRDSPDEKNMLPFGAAEEADQSGDWEKPAEQNNCYTRGLKKRDWGILIPTILMIGVVANTGYSHLTLLFTSQNLNPQQIAFALSIYGSCLLCGKLFYGTLSDRFGSYICNWGYCAMLVFGMFSISVAGRYPSLLYPGVATTGTGMAISIVGLVAWAGDLCSKDEYDDTVRWFQLLLTIGGLILNMMPGILADRFNGSYVPAYLIMLSFSVFLTAGIQTVYRFHRK